MWFSHIAHGLQAPKLNTVPKCSLPGAEQREKITPFDTAGHPPCFPLKVHSLCKSDTLVFPHSPIEAEVTEAACNDCLYLLKKQYRHLLYDERLLYIISYVIICWHYA